MRLCVGLLSCLLAVQVGAAQPLAAVPSSRAPAKPAARPAAPVPPAFFSLSNMTNPSSPVTAFFYQRPAVLDRNQHQALRLRDAGFGFAARTQAVPVLAAEFAPACLEYPIVFNKGADGQWLALALTGLQRDTNAFVDAQGRWTGRYVPASVRRYPFILAEGPQTTELSLAADLAAPHFAAQGEPLFDAKGEPTELVRQRLAFLADFQGQARATATLAQQLEAAGLLESQRLQVRLPDGREAVVDQVWIVNEEKLRALGDTQALAWFKGGELAAIHAHMLSLRNLAPLLERSVPAPASASAPANPAAPTAQASATAPAAPAPAASSTPAPVSAPAAADPAPAAPAEPAGPRKGLGRKA